MPDSLTGKGGGGGREPDRESEIVMKTEFKKRSKQGAGEEWGKWRGSPTPHISLSSRKSNLVEIRGAIFHIHPPVFLRPTAPQRYRRLTHTSWASRRENKGEEKLEECVRDSDGRERAEGRRGGSKDKRVMDWDSTENGDRERLSSSSWTMTLW